MNDEYKNLISEAECFQLNKTTWFAYITKTKYVCAIGDSKKEALEFLSDNLKGWLSLGKPAEMLIEDTLAIVKELCKELEKLELSLGSMGDGDEIIFKEVKPKKADRSESRLIEVSNEVAFQNMNKRLWIMGTNVNAPFNFRFRTHKTNSGGFICTCDKIGCDIICYDEHDLLDYCIRTVADIINIEEHYINVVIEIPGNE